MLKHLTITAALIGLTSCASIIEGGDQKIKLSTDQPTPVRCDLRNSRGNWTTVTTPSTVDISRSQSRLHIACDSVNYSGVTSNQAGPEAWTLGNILLGGVIGLGIDAATGSMFSYDDEIVVPLKAKFGDNVTIMEAAPTESVASAPVPAPAPAPQPLMQEEVIAEQSQPKLIPVVVPRRQQTMAPVATPVAAPVVAQQVVEAAPAPRAVQTQGYVSQIPAPVRAGQLPPSQF